jgi:hypothetical protein
MPDAAALFARWRAEDLAYAGRDLADTAAARYAEQLEKYKREATALGVRSLGLVLGTDTNSTPRAAPRSTAPGCAADRARPARARSSSLPSVRVQLSPSRVEAHVLRGDVCGLAGPMAVDYAHAAHCDVAVMGSRGLGAFKRCGTRAAAGARIAPIAEWC